MLRGVLVRGLSVRMGDESQTILREWTAGLLNSLRARVPWCARRMTKPRFWVAAIDPLANIPPIAHRDHNA
jgi:hypothetical protein